MTIRRAPLYEAVTALRGGEQAPSAYAEQCLARIESIDTEVHAFLPEPDRRARVGAEATAVADRFPEADDRPPLFGVPVGVKDIFHVDGLPTRAGADLPLEALAGPEAAAVTRLRDAGAVVLGKTVTTEFAYFDPGPTRNPHDVEHTPGGSSSGSAAAVAAGLSPLALGTQTAGSVIRPAAFCGVVGFKPTYGRIPIDGVIALAPSLDTVGLFTQDVAGARLAASVLCDDWDVGASEGAAGGNDRPTLGVPDEAYLAKASEEGRSHFATRLDRLERAGYEIVRTQALSDVDLILEDHATLMAGEAAQSHEEWFVAYGERYAPVTAELIHEGRETPPEAISDVRDGRAVLRESLAASAADRGIDVWVAPSAPGPAPRGLESTGNPIMNAPWTYAGLPAITAPAGDVDGLPLGLQCVAVHGDDELLLDWAGPIADVLESTGA